MNNTRSHSYTSISHSLRCYSIMSLEVLGEGIDIFKTLLIEKAKSSPLHLKHKVFSLLPLNHTVTSVQCSDRMSETFTKYK